ncbi:MAG: hypothetical protein V4622_07370 [Bacteroidota bacterium]
MKKYILNFLVLSVLVTIFSACSSSNVDERFVKRWTLTKVVGFGPEKDKVLGVNNIFFDLKDDETFTARWYKEESLTDFVDLKGTWLTTTYGDKADLFLFYGPKKKSKIFTVTKVTGGMMIMRLSEIDHIFEGK